MNEQEEAFVRSFIIEQKQERYLGFLSKPDKRGKFQADLYHRLAFKSNLAEEVPSNQRRVEKVEQRLRQLGSGELVYVISVHDDLDQQWRSLSEVLEEILSMSIEAILCCLPGELAFYKSEDSAWILHHPKLRIVQM